MPDKLMPDAAVEHPYIYLCMYINNLFSKKKDSSYGRAFVMGMQMAAMHPDWASVFIEDIDENISDEGKIAQIRGMDSLANKFPFV